MHVLKAEALIDVFAQYKVKDMVQYLYELRVSTCSLEYGDMTLRRTLFHTLGMPSLNWGRIYLRHSNLEDVVSI